MNIVFFFHFVVGHYGKHALRKCALAIHGGKVPEMKTKHDNDLCPAMVIENGRLVHKFRSFRPPGPHTVSKHYTCILHILYKIILLAPLYITYRLIHMVLKLFVNGGVKISKTSNSRYVNFER